MPRSRPAPGQQAPALAVALLLVLGTAASSHPPAAAGNPFPLGERLRPRVDFWVQVYSRYTTDQAVFHDADEPAIVYQVVSLEGRREWRDIERFLRPIGQRYVDTLRDLAAGAPAPGDGDAVRVLALFGPGVTPNRLRRAADNVRFQRGQADAFLEGLVRRGAYEEHLRRVFQAEGVPYDLTYLPHVESSFRPQAYSRSGAAGIWQFTRSTGRHYLEISSTADARWDPIEATRAAARLLRHNYEELHSWPLAITAYNHGLEGMRRAVLHTGTTDIEAIIERYEGRVFGFASKNFYSEFLAAREVATHAGLYFGTVPRWAPLQYQELRLDRAAAAPELMRALGLSVCDLTHYNPALRPVVVAGERLLPAGYRLKIPQGTVPEGTSAASLLEALRRPMLRAAESAPRHAEVAMAATPAPPPASIALLFAMPAAGPGAGGASFLLDAALLWSQLPAPARASGPPPGPPALQKLARAPAASPPPLALAPPAAAPMSPWRSLGTAFPLHACLHPDWAPWMREPLLGGLPQEPALAVLLISDGKMRVEPEESLQLVASWLRLPASRLRELNDLRAGQPLRLGQWVRVDLSRVSEQEFVERRLSHQRELAASFMRDHRVTSTQVHEVQPGDTLWSIARRYGRLPLWLLRWYNDGSAWPQPSPGSQVVVPIVERLSS